MTAATDTSGEEHGHQHRDVSGGWLRPAVFGAMDGLVTNVSLIAGVGGGGGTHQALVLTGLAGLAAGAFSMATGEYVSVSSQNELVRGGGQQGADRAPSYTRSPSSGNSPTCSSAAASTPTWRPRSPCRCPRTRRRRCASTYAKSWASTTRTFRRR